MKHIFLTTILVAFIFFLGSSQPPVLAESKHSVIIHFANEEGKMAALKASTEVTAQYEYLPMLAADISNSQLKQLQSQPGITAIEPNEVVNVLEEVTVIPTVATTEANQWNLIAVNSATAWNDGLTGKGVKIAIIDSGIAVHSDLNIAGGVSFIGDSSSDDHGHGTHIAGIIAAQHNGFGAAGIAPNAEIYAVKVLDREGAGDVAQVLKGIDWAIENKMDIINLSFGDLQELGPLKEAIQTAYQHGIFIVAASGNNGEANGSGNTMFYPARYKEAIAVASIDKNLSRSSWSGTGPKNEFSAPGEEVYSTYLNGQYATKQGTSVAAPHVVGVLALLKEKYPYLSNDELRQGLQLYTQDLGETGRDDLYGYGLLKYTSSTVRNLQEAKLVNEAKNGIVTVEQARKAVNAMAVSKEKLHLTNDLNSIQYELYEQLQSLLAAFEKNPTTINYERVESIVTKMEQTDLKEQAQNKMATVMAKISEAAHVAVVAFEKNKTVVNHKRVVTELKTLPVSEMKRSLEKRVESSLQVMVKPTIIRLESFVKNPTVENYHSAQIAITNVPPSALKNSLKAQLQQKTDSLLKGAKTAVATYEKSQKLVDYHSAIKAVQKAYITTEKTALTKRINKIVNNNLKKATTRVANYEKAKTKKNLQLAMSILNELPKSTEKSALLKRLKK